MLKCFQELEDMRSKMSVRKGAWTEEEDLLLKQCIQKYGEGKWHLIPQRAGLNRCRKSCRLRWLNYLKPDIKRGEFTWDEIDLMQRLHKLLGNRWSLIAGRLPGRTSNDVKNYWNAQQRKKACPNDNAENETINIIKPQAIKLSNSFPSMRERKGKSIETNHSRDMFEKALWMSPKHDEVPWREDVLAENKGNQCYSSGSRSAYELLEFVESMEPPKKERESFVDELINLDFLALDISLWEWGIL